MEKAKQRTTSLENLEKIAEIYDRVVIIQDTPIKKGYIVCPECNQEILLVPTLRKMNEAIENHINKHRLEIEDNPLIKHIKPINIRLALARQTIEQLRATSSGTDDS